jgi:hypothetical protein
MWSRGRSSGFELKTRILARARAVEIPMLKRSTTRRSDYRPLYSVLQFDSIAKRRKCVSKQVVAGKWRFREILARSSYKRTEKNPPSWSSMRKIAMPAKPQRRPSVFVYRFPG